jgi:hypothetical protein
MHKIGQNLSYSMAFLSNSNVFPGPTLTRQRRKRVKRFEIGLLQANRTMILISGEHATKMVAGRDLK